MTQETTCPACGAPLIITSPQDALRCAFCGADLVIQDEAGEAKFRVVGQPEPQKETLSKPVEPDLGEMDAQSTAEAERFQIPPVESVPQPPSFQPELSSSGAGVYSAGQERSTASGSKRWLWIGGAVVLGLLLLCICLVVVIASLFPAIFA